MNSMYGGGYGGYGVGGYGGYGMNGMYGPGMGMYGQPPPFDPNNPSLTQTLESTTQHTFTLLHSIVQTFTGVAQMLESTFMATHSSFFAMVGVIDQFGQLRNALGSVLGLFGLVRWMKDTLTGQRSSGGMRGEFKEFINGRPVQGPSGPPAPKPSKKPLIIFLLAIFGIPYAMHKLVRILTERQQQQAQILAGPAGLPPLDPSQLTFARTLYPFEASSPSELTLKENEIVAIMGKLDPATGQEVDPRLEVCLGSLSLGILISRRIRWKAVSGGKDEHEKAERAGSQKSGYKFWRGARRLRAKSRRLIETVKAVSLEVGYWIAPLVFAGSLYFTFVSYSLLTHSIIHGNMET
jgi:peroxin-13